jgi:hypothetical protein
MSDPIESDQDPTYTHFTHHREFTSLLADFLRRTVLDAQSSEKDEKEETKLVDLMGGIVCTPLPLYGVICRGSL